VCCETDRRRPALPVYDVSIVIVASGGANIASLQFALERLGTPSEVSADAARIRSASHVILPGVGAAADAMARLRARGLDELIPSLTQPVLGICLGMQLLHEASAEGDTRCLGIIPGAAERFVELPGRPVPHMGWNTLEAERECPLLAGLGASDYAYFVHSYALPVSGATVASCRYGARFSACVSWRNFFGVQFHPERSARVGARILENFLAIGPGETTADTRCA
jgi:glutamine amidotransferase